MKRFRYILTLLFPRIYVDVVFNHMTIPHNDSVGTGGSTADPDTYSYPGVPYTEEHFNFPVCEVNDYNNATEVSEFWYCL